MTMFIFSQGLAGLAFFLDLAAFHFTRRAVSLAVLATSTTLLAVHFWLLAQPGAAGLMALAACRYMTAIVTTRPGWLWGFLAAASLCSAVTWDSALSALPLAGSLLMTYAAFHRQADALRLITLCGSTCWLVNNIVMGSPMAAMMESAFMLSTLCSWQRLKRQADNKNSCPLPSR